MRLKDWHLSGESFIICKNRRANFPTLSVPVYGLCSPAVLRWRQTFITSKIKPSIPDHKFQIWVRLCMWHRLLSMVEECWDLFWLVVLILFCSCCSFKVIYVSDTHSRWSTDLQVFCGTGFLRSLSSSLSNLCSAGDFSLFTQYFPLQWFWKLKFSSSRNLTCAHLRGNCNTLSMWQHSLVFTWAACIYLFIFKFHDVKFAQYWILIVIIQIKIFFS